MLCLMSGCDKPSRARGYCDTHYRQVKDGHTPRDAGRPSLDHTVWKIRVKSDRGSQPYYFSNREQAYKRAEAAMDDGTLRFFARYELSERLM